MSCTPTPLETQSVARVWDEQALSLIRQSSPAPGVHARNLFHLSAVMWDAWAAYDPGARGYFFDQKLQADDVDAARAAAISFAAYWLLKYRYAEIGALDGASDELDQTMQSLCYRPTYQVTGQSTPAALGISIGLLAISAMKNDGAFEQDSYVDPTYSPINKPLVVTASGTVMRDPNRWQPIKFPPNGQTDQQGRPLPGGVQKFIGPQWGHVTSFALPSSPEGTPIDPGPPPRLGDPLTDAAYKQSAIDLLRFSSELDPTDGVTEDISPASLGANTLGTNDGDGHAVNPITGQPYEPDVVLRADFQRALAEFWADGPNSETPPGHWNVIANAVSDTPGFAHRFSGVGPELERLEWDVKLYFALNGALHDAAIAAWGLKGHSDSARPISMIRYMAGKGQSSDPSLPSYDPQGLPLVRGLVELITRESTRRGGRHEELAGHEGEVAVRAWRGFPEDPTAQTSGVGWILGVDWVPYQRVTFVTPSFAGYVSGHSTFSRAAAEVMTAITGSEYFPGGLATWTKPAGSLRHEVGPTTDVVLQWATYYDAADLAGISRLYMGIHIAADDFEGRKIGATCGTGAWTLANQYFGN